jgi:hypothetical protein
VINKKENSTSETHVLGSVENISPYFTDVHGSGIGIEQISNDFESVIYVGLLYDVIIDLADKWGNKLSTKILLHVNEGEVQTHVCASYSSNTYNFNRF